MLPAIVGPPGPWSELRAGASENAVLKPAQ